MSNHHKKSIQQSIEGFHPEKSRIGGGQLADFLRAPITGHLEEVPGVGPATATLLRAAGVDTTHALLGKFLTFKTAGVEPVEHLDRMYFWLASLQSASGFRAGICHAVAEKVNCMMPGIYDADIYCRDDSR